MEESKETKSEIQRSSTSIGLARAQRSIYLSICQIYNETLTDLLSEGKGDPRKCKIRRNQGGNYFAENITEKLVKTPEEVYKYMKKAQSRRISRATDMNEGSSRSHLVTTLTLVDISKGKGKNKVFKGSKLNLVDLAGSERTKDSGVTGDAMKEAININLSLDSLKAVVNSLTAGTKENLIPYNRSILTKLLSDSLGGNCMTTLVACVSPS